MGVVGTVDRMAAAVNARGLRPLVAPSLNVGAEPCAASCLGAFEDNLEGEEMIRVNFSHHFMFVLTVASGLTSSLRMTTTFVSGLDLKVPFITVGASS